MATDCTFCCTETVVEPFLPWPCYDFSLSLRGGEKKITNYCLKCKEVHYITTTVHLLIIHSSWITNSCLYSKMLDKPASTLICTFLHYGFYVWAALCSSRYLSGTLSSTMNEAIDTTVQMQMLNCRCKDKCSWKSTGNIELFQGKSVCLCGSERKGSISP